MAVPNMFILYVSDAPASARFYSGLFGMKPVFETPAFIAFDLAGGIQLALWSAGPADSVPSRTSELCLTLEGGPDEIDRTFHAWRAKEVAIVKAPHDAVFGRTFVAADPDGNLIRVAPVD